MRVSELAKQLGYRAAELVELAKDRGLPINSTRDNVDARTAAAVRAQLPPRSKLTGAMKDLFEKIKVELASRPKETKTVTRKTTRTKKATATRRKKTEETEVAEKPKTTEVAEVAEVAEKPAAKVETKKTTPKPKTIRKTKIVQEFHLGAESAGRPEQKTLLKKKAHTFTPEELEEIKRETAKGLINVDDVIGKERVVRVMRAAEMEKLERTKEEQDRERKKAAARASGTRAVARPVTRVTPRAPTQQERPRRRIKGPPIAKPTVSIPRQKQIIIPPSERDYTIQVPITLKAFSQEVGVKANALISKLVGMGQMVGMSAILDADLVELLSTEFDRKVKVVTVKKAEEVFAEVTEKEESRPEDVVPRAPVVTFLGHVDHGKTSLLDRIRNTNVAAGEAGGITQHIGAYKLKTKEGREVVFLDTPGHKAFTEMRARGAKATDLVVLVVAADDGVMPQTEEAYNHTKAAAVPVVIAVNKVDKASSNVNKVKGQLAGIGLQTEDWGGKTTCVEVSALTGHNVDQLVEMIALEAELLELKANPKLRGRGVVLEARKTGARGIVSTFLVQDGTLRKGDIVLAGRAYGRVRSMTDDQGNLVDEAGPATPVGVAGLDRVPDVGEKFQVVANLKQAKDVVEERRRKDVNAERLAKAKHVTLENLFAKIEGGTKEVKVVLKVDAFGSLEVLRESLKNLSTDEVRLLILHSAVGSIAESDILLADASDAIVLGFCVEADDRTKMLAKDKGVDIRTYKVIYELIEEMEAALEGLLEPDLVPVTIGHLAVKETFRISGTGVIAGCLVTDGKVERGANLRLIRNGKVVYEGKIESLRRFKDDVKEVAEGYECGLKVVKHDDVKPGDVVEAYTIQEVARKLQKKS